MEIRFHEGLQINVDDNQNAEFIVSMVVFSLVWVVLTRLAEGGSTGRGRVRFGLGCRAVVCRVWVEVRACSGAGAEVRSCVFVPRVVVVMVVVVVAWVVVVVAVSDPHGGLMDLRPGRRMPSNGRNWNRWGGLSEYLEWRGT